MDDALLLGLRDPIKSPENGALLDRYRARADADELLHCIAQLRELANFHVDCISLRQGSLTDALAWRARCRAQSEKLSDLVEGEPKGFRPTDELDPLQYFARVVPVPLERLCRSLEEALAFVEANGLDANPSGGSELANRETPGKNHRGTSMNPVHVYRVKSREPRWRAVFRRCCASVFGVRVTRGPLRRACASLIVRVLAALLVVVTIVPNLAIDPQCIVALEGAGAPCDDDRGPCPCPLDCTTCTAVRAVPPADAPVAGIVPLPRPAGPPPIIEAARRPRSPDPSEIVHIPKA